jgi:spore maturation protein CgeB
VGYFQEEHVGYHFECAARILKIPYSTFEFSQAKSNLSTLNKLAWHFRDRTYWDQKSFQKKIIETAKIARPSHLLVLGTSGVYKETLIALQKLSITTINFLTDDPWNTAHSSTWFHESLPHYDLLLTPRKANISQLNDFSKTRVDYLPFAYNPEVHFEEMDISETEQKELESDIMFFGGADSDRIPFIHKLIRHGFKINLFGGYWERDNLTRPFSRGIVPLKTLRKAIKVSKICLNLVRRANRDGHVMRTFEIPAMGGCLLTEKTEEHLAIFGDRSVKMFVTEKDLLQEVETLLSSPELRKQTTLEGRKKILSSKNTYADRLQSILHLAS